MGFGSGARARAGRARARPACESCGHHLVGRQPAVGAVPGVEEARQAAGRQGRDPGVVEVEVAVAPRLLRAAGTAGRRSGGPASSARRGTRAGRPAARGRGRRRGVVRDGGADQALDAFDAPSRARGASSSGAKSIDGEAVDRGRATTASRRSPACRGSSSRRRAWSRRARARSAPWWCWHSPAPRRAASPPAGCARAARRCRRWPRAGGRCPRQVARRRCARSRVCAVSPKLYPWVGLFGHDAAWQAPSLSITLRE